MPNVTLTEKWSGNYDWTSKTMGMGVTIDNTCVLERLLRDRSAPALTPCARAPLSARTCLAEVAPVIALRASL